MSVSYRKRLFIFSRDFFKCRKCGNSPAFDEKVILHIDHILPICKGGKDQIENLQTLCLTCNLKKSKYLDGDLIERNKMKDFKIKYNVKPIFYPKQTAEDRKWRLSNNLCVIHAFPAKKYEENIFICPKKNCFVMWFINKQGKYELYSDSDEYLMMGSFSFFR